MFNWVILSLLYFLFIAHIYELLFQNHYDRNGWKFILKGSMDPAILLSTAIFYHSRFITTTLGNYALFGLYSEFIIHVVHFGLILQSSFILYKGGERPLWYSLMFNIVDIFVLIIAMYPASYMHTPHEIVNALIVGTIITLTSYRFFANV